MNRRLQQMREERERTLGRVRKKKSLSEEQKRKIRFDNS